MTSEDRQRATRRRRASLRVGRIAGIDVRVHATFVVLIALVVATAGAPGGPTVAGELVWIALLFAAITVHELAHGVVARGYGVDVEEIDLLPIGGVSKLGALPDDPRRQLDIALAGPLASIGIGLGAATLVLATGGPLWPPTLFEGPLLARVAWANLLLAAFNLLPAYPLDGGRALRALLAERMDGDRATAVAARTGRRIALVMIVLGAVANLWLLVIGVFVYVGGRVEEAAQELRRALAGLRVGDVTVAALPPALVGRRLSAPVEADALVADTDLLDADFVARPAVRGGQVVGYVTRGDLEAVVDDLVARQRHRPPSPPSPASPAPPGRGPAAPPA